ncbi:MAG: 7-cyano-7-deazaguanine synthase QueC, partial [Smithellaceae bacterium]|nr:7-cyano-7-deazaguanine synthase QueC [Smithellaceae bacterium]
MTGKKWLVLLSGGLDSVVLLHYAARHATVKGALSFSYGAKHNLREIPFARRHCDILNIPHRVIDLEFIGSFFKSDLLCSGGDIPEGHYEDASMKQTVVPFRNGIMLSIAAGYAESIGADGVAIAAHGGDHAIYPDCRREFMSSMADAIRLGTYAGIELASPFIGMSKAEIVSRGAEMNVDLSQTWSCYKGAEFHCGKCGTCVERREAFVLAGIVDPTVYE